jgi:predicted metal-dependent hydrolase
MLYYNILGHDRLTFKKPLTNRPTLCAFQPMDDLQPETLALPSGLARVEWRRSSRARRVSLRIDPAGGAVVVTLPTKATRKAGMALLMGHAEWVSSRLAALPDALPFAAGVSVPIAGIPHRIRHAPTARGAAFLLDQELHVTGAPEFLQRRVRDFLRKEAQRRLGALVAAKSAVVGVAPRRVTMKDTTSRWGSCAPDKSLALSWRLVMAPSFVQDYVVAHEVAHLRHMNHGQKFWALVDRLTPHTKAAIPWLRAEGVRLLRIG